ncbi:MFS general substrate transporter [Metschnikowia bicuspidata var. bicuspidata NRRL YB-4993]|uniref:MFS general substrate transporter n=1 Tax=Metschnikowia bicuspidata var. bicuspidata NRRL YB-4993 TaxID=869754 RepID=A0A1A0HBX4_9ASCO|nr:MFS general substrate transporter [Metschnikowia bicuspidata var. bicuspidata NRRL YB-4993]OBA21377.1 MFS general substrate transporter [Metschnikowia bicuspidata var. bicuspidata NRRL YB-4993]
MPIHPDPQSLRASKEEIPKKHDECLEKDILDPKTDPETARPKSLQAVESKASTGSTRSAGRVPKSERRGLLSSLTILPEYYDPRSYRTLQKISVVLIVAFAAVSGPMGTTILLPAVKDLYVDLDTSVATVNISVGIYLLSLGIFPMWWTNFSERHGRRSVYVLSFAWFFAFSIACAVAPSIGSLIAFRLLAGVGASAVQSCGAGTISDLYVQEERGTALGLFYLGPLLGPFMSPIIGGAVAEAWGWRASMWIMVIVCGLSFVLIVFFLPETLPRNNAEVMMSMVQEALQKDEGLELHDLYRTVSLSGNLSLGHQVFEEMPVDVLMPTVLRHLTSQSFRSMKACDPQVVQSEKESGEAHGKAPLALRNKAPPQLREKQTWASYAYDYTIRPMHAVVLLTCPQVLLAIAYCGIGATGIYFLNITISNAYAEAPYNFSPVIIGLMYVPNSVTFILASIYGGRWNDWLIKRSAARNNGELRPEFRLSWNIALAAAVYPPACLIFGWCIEKKQHWVTPLVGSALLGISAMIIMGATMTYLVDLLPGRGATGVALNNLMRQILAATATFVTEPATSAVGAGVLFSIYAGVVTAAVLLVVYLKKRGAHLREKYDITSYYAKM